MSAALPLLIHAACAGYPEPLWDDTVPGEQPATRRARHRRALVICSTCPDRDQCHPGGALTTSGIWAGEPVPEPTRTARCLGCGDFFAAPSSQYRYCRPSCRPPRHRPPRPPRPARCLRCGDPFTQRDSRHRYCRLSCRRPPRPPRPPRPRRPGRAAPLVLPDRVCAHCPARFAPINRTHRYCGSWCRRRHDTELRAQRRAQRRDAHPPPPAPVPPEPPGLTPPDRAVVLAVAHGQAPLSSLPREHRWIAAHAHRAAGLSTAESAALLACSRSSVLRHRQPPPAGAVA